MDGADSTTVKKSEFNTARNRAASERKVGFAYKRRGF